MGKGGDMGIGVRGGVRSNREGQGTRARSGGYFPRRRVTSDANAQSPWMKRPGRARGEGET